MTLKGASSTDLKSTYYLKYSKVWRRDWFPRSHTGAMRLLGKVSPPNQFHGLLVQSAPSGIMYRTEGRRMPRTFEDNNKQRLYWVWGDMRKRCRGKGITICPAWDDFNVFYSDMSPGYQTGFSLDRIDSKGGYEAGNCQWLSKSEHGKKSNKACQSLSWYTIWVSVENSLRGSCWQRRLVGCLIGGDPV
jgi:hypothetical protein